MSMIDLLGTHTANPLEADYLTVLSDLVIKNIQQYSGARPNQTFLITGNPAFDSIFDERGPVDYAWRRRYLPAMPERAKALLWIDTPAYYNTPGLRSKDDIATDLEWLAKATRHSNACLLIRPHPSQPRSLFDDWMRTAPFDHIFFAGDLPLHPLLRAIDAVAMYDSTVGCEAVLMQRPVIQLNYHGSVDGLPLGHLGLARLVNTPEDLREAVRDTLTAHSMNRHLGLQAAQLFPQEKAAPKIAAHIKHIVAGENADPI